MDRRRKTDQLPPVAGFPAEAVERARVLCDAVAGAGFGIALALHVPDDGSDGVPCAGAGRWEPVLDIARGMARRVVRERRAMHVLDAESPHQPAARRHAAFPIGRTASGTMVLVVADQRLTRREIQALAVWAAPSIAPDSAFPPPSAEAPYAAIAPIAASAAHEFDADVVAFALFAQAGMMLHLHVRSGALLHTCRVPMDTVWGEVARHGAAFSLGDLRAHPGAHILASLGMRSAGLVGLENGNGIAIGAMGLASRELLDVGVAHELLARSAQIGPDLMARLSSTRVPVPAPDGSVDLAALAARVGCRRFAMYERRGSELHMVAAHAADGSRLVSPPDVFEADLVWRAARERVGLAASGAAAVSIGEHAVLYAQDPTRSALECLRRALHDVRRNPFGAADDVDGEQFDADAA